MKTSLRKLVATVSGLAIAAVLPMASMMASAEGEVSLDFEAEKVEDQIILSANVAGLDQAAGHVWNVLEYSIEYDADQVTPVQQNNGRNDVDYLPGDALYLQGGNCIVQVNLNTNPVLVGAIDADAQIDNGEIMNIAFDLKDGVNAEDVALTVKVSQFAKAVIVDKKPQSPEDQVAPFTVEVKVSGTEPTQPTESQPTESQPTETQPTESKPTESQPTKDTDTSDTDVSVVPGPSDDDAQPTLPSTDITVDGGNGGSGSGAGTGESTVLFVVALVLMAGSAAALVVMKKKKVFSK